MNDKIESPGYDGLSPTEAALNVNALPGPYTTTVKLLKDQSAGGNSSYYIGLDAVLALDEGIEPTWTATHTFKLDASFLGNLNLAQTGKPTAATLGLDAASLKYAVVAASGKHEFYVGGNAVGQIDDPANPQADSSLVSKSYVDKHGGGGGVQPADPKNPAVSIGSKVSNGTATTYMRSDVVLALDQSISPQWSASHTFLGAIQFGSPTVASLSQDGASLKYAVSATHGGVHEFYIGGKLAGQIDSPAVPAGDTSLVSKSYVDAQIPHAGDPATPGVNLSGSAGSKTTYLRSDAVLALDQSIAPKWTGSHTFTTQTNFQAAVNLAQTGKPTAASLSLDVDSLKYAVVAASAAHEFYIGGKAVGQIDDPANPQTDASLVSKSYVDTHGGGNSIQPGKPKHPAVSLGSAVSDGTAATYMRSDVVLQLDQGISPQWSAAHSFLAGINFGATAAANLSLDHTSLKYAVTAGVHEFYVAGKLVGQIDTPQTPGSDSSLVSKSYVDSQAVPPTFKKFIAISNLALGLDDQPASTGSSRGSLAIGRNAQATGDGAVALGDSCSTTAGGGIVIGNLAACTGSNSITLGNGSNDGGKGGVLSVGNAGPQNQIYRRIINMADGQDDNDAATVGQLKKINGGAQPSFTTYFRGTFTGLPDGMGGEGVSPVMDWPLAASAQFAAGTDTHSKASLAVAPSVASITFCLCLNDQKVGSVVFAKGQTAGVITWDAQTSLKMGDVLTLTTPHPPVASNESAKNLTVVLAAKPQ